MDTCVFITAPTVVAQLEEITGLYNEAVDLVLDLPDTADGIAKFLSDIGVDGRRGSSRGCPLGRYLRRSVQATDDVDMAVSNGALFLACGPHELKYYLPTHVLDFIRAFDSSAYPDLVTKPANE